MGLIFKYTICLIVTILFISLIKVDGRNYEPVTYTRFKEITKEDITLYPNIKSKDITVFGLYLSMKLEEIVRELNQYDFLYVEKDVFNENRLYIYEDKGNDSDNALAYLILDENTYDLQEIVLYPNMIKYLIGNSRKLLTLEMTNQYSDIVRYFTGIPEPRKKIMDIPALKMESYSYYYQNRNFIFTKNKIDKRIKISLSLVEYSN